MNYGANCDLCAPIVDVITPRMFQLVCVTQVMSSHVRRSESVFTHVGFGSNTGQIVSKLDRIGSKLDWIGSKVVQIGSKLVQIGPKRNKPGTSSDGRQNVLKSDLKKSWICSNLCPI